MRNSLAEDALPIIWCRMYVGKYPKLDIAHIAHGEWQFFNLPTVNQSFQSFPSSTFGSHNHI